MDKRINCSAQSKSTAPLDCNIALKVSEKSQLKTSNDSVQYNMHGGKRRKLCLINNYYNDYECFDNESENKFTVNLSFLCIQKLFQLNNDEIQNFKNIKRIEMSDKNLKCDEIEKGKGDGDGDRGGVEKEEVTNEEEKVEKTQELGNKKVKGEYGKEEKKKEEDMIKKVVAGEEIEVVLKKKKADEEEGENHKIVSKNIIESPIGRTVSDDDECREEISEDDSIEQNRNPNGTQNVAAAKLVNGIKPETELHNVNSSGNITATAAAAAAATANTTSTTLQTPTPHSNNNNHLTNVEKTSSVTSTRTNSQNSSPILGHNAKKIAKTVLSSTSPLQLDKKSSAKVQTTRKFLLKKQQHASEDAPNTPATDSMLDSLELQQSKLLNRHSCNGRVNFESLERHLKEVERLKQQHEKGVEAMAVMLKYLVEDMDAFACPVAKCQTVKTQKQLNTTLNLLEDAKSAYTELQDHLCDKEAYYTQREEELQTLHRCELEKAQSNLNEYQIQAKRQISTLENELSQKQNELAKAEERERILQQRLSDLEISERILKEKLAAESAYVSQLQAAAEREQDLNERVRLLTKQIEDLRLNNGNSERELRNKLSLSQDEIAILRTSNKTLNNSLDRASLPRGSTGSSASHSASEISRLQCEAESLRCVLELKQQEISKLSKQNEELMRDAEERLALQGKLSLLEASNELLQTELNIKSEREKDCMKRLDEIQKAWNHDTTTRTRLKFDNEALQWQLKQRSEQLHIVEAKLQESLNMTGCNNSSLLSQNRSSANSSKTLNNGSPPSSPIIKGVIKKNDSVSWVLEMDDDTPETAATKMVKRAGSFRSVERSGSSGLGPIRRQVSVGSNVKPTSIIVNDGAGPNPLSQSMSAASVIRPHSNETERSQARSRSKSMTIKDSDVEPPKNMTSTPHQNGRKNSHHNRHHQHGHGTKTPSKLVSNAAWQEPDYTSSPYVGQMRPRTSTMKSMAAIDDAADGKPNALFHPPTSSKLITCDTSTLNSGERLDMHSLPKQPSIHALKEAAGEAMVSGTNSEEDDGCSASSDEVVSTSSTTTSAHSNMSLEEVLMLEKMGSFNGTPMEMSWSDDAEIFGTNGTSSTI